MDAIKIMADEKTVISYRPKFNKHTGSVLATILLQQAAYWWCKMGEQPYYKFKEPCNAPQYRDGESWCEELGFSRREFDTACTMLEERGFIHKKTDMSRLTWYTVSQEKISEMMDLVHGSRKGGNALYVKAESAVTYRRKTPLYNGGKRLLTIQENTQEITTVETAVEKPVEKKPRTQKTAMPTNFGLSDAVKAWAAEHGHTNLEAHLDYFKGYVVANGKKYANWDQALMNAIRGDWAKLKGKTWQQPSQPAQPAVEPLTQPIKHKYSTHDTVADPAALARLRSML